MSSWNRNKVISPFHIRRRGLVYQQVEPAKEMRKDKVQLCVCETVDGGQYVGYVLDFAFNGVEGIEIS